MKRVLVAFWLAQLFLPIAGALTPLPASTCLVCATHDHRNCEAQGHACAHTRSRPCHQITKSEPSANPRIGHKCAQPQAAAILQNVTAAPLRAYNLGITLYEARAFSGPASPPQEILLTQIDHPPCA